MPPKYHATHTSMHEGFLNHGLMKQILFDSMGMMPTILARSYYH
jgi:hypothetical protein